MRQNVLKKICDNCIYSHDNLSQMKGFQNAVMCQNDNKIVFKNSSCNNFTLAPTWEQLTNNIEVIEAEILKPIQNQLSLEL